MRCKACDRILREQEMIANERKGYTDGYLCARCMPITISDATGKKTVVDTNTPINAEGLNDHQIEKYLKENGE
jgi:hypothetical protein